MITTSSPTFLGLITMSVMLLAYMVIVQMVWAGLISLKQPDDDPTKANGKTEGLKPYFYVLNNLLRATIDPKVGVATSVQNHDATILVCFGLKKRFSVTDLLWHHIEEGS
jgi:hypothetical protein